MSTAKWFATLRSYFSPQTLRNKRYGDALLRFYLINSINLINLSPLAFLL